MTKLEKNESIIKCLVAAFDLDREQTIQRIENMIKDGNEVIKFKEWTNLTVRDLGSFERKYWAKGGSVMRKMSIKSFIKENKIGRFLVRLDDQMVFVRDGMFAIGRGVSDRSRIINVFKIL